MLLTDIANQSWQSFRLNSEAVLEPAPPRSWQPLPIDLPSPLRVRRLESREGQ